MKTIFHKNFVPMRISAFKNCIARLTRPSLRTYFSLFVALPLLSGSCYPPADTWPQQSAGKPWSIQFVTDNVRAGKQAVRFEVRKGDAYVSRRKASFRAELDGRNVFKAKMGEEYWYGFSMFMPIDFPVHANRLVIGQWHATHDVETDEVKRSPVLSQRYSNGIFYVKVRHSSDKVQTSNDGEKDTLYKTNSFEKSVWHDFIYHIKWSYKDDGFVEMWLDGNRVINYRGPVGYNDDEGPFFKYGIYRNDVPETYVIFFDEFRCGESFKEVDPAGGTPVD